MAYMKRSLLLDEMRDDHLLTPGEVAALFRVDPKTVNRWSKPNAAGFTRLDSITLPSGHRRYRASVIRALRDRREMDS